MSSQPHLHNAQHYPRERHGPDFDHHVVARICLLGLALTLEHLLREEQGGAEGLEAFYDCI